MTPRLAILTDFPEEGWPSMDLCGDMLLDHLPRQGPLATEPARLCPKFRPVAARVPILGRRGAAFNADRLFNRFVAYPRHLLRSAHCFDLFHVADHTYAQLVHGLPAGRAGVYCHDLDAFRCLIDGSADPRPRWFRALARRILDGMRKAAVVFHNTDEVGGQIRRYGLVDPDRLVHAPLGVAPEFAADGARTPERPRWLADLGGRPLLLHVGSCIPRKRIDVLLDVVAAIRRRHPDARLVKVGGTWTSDQRARMARLALDGEIIHVHGLTRAELAAVYRRVQVVLVPSEAEGFGLPVIEALACGAAVAASDLPALREAGGPAAGYAPVGDVAAWAGLISGWLEDPAAPPSRAARLAWASRFTWKAHAEAVARAYRRIL
ncbi:glycosyltransferase (plasmid) [Tundrisphaera sp. TA3]|uniref:glycosyltransferase n=1 Tax=Tundrisphaera sp. TA3 TaxID=3435775 RepID=UPI003EBDB57D